MKGRLLEIAPQAHLVDISHEIAPQDIVQGAWCLRQAIGEYPHGAIHVAVVDPGVGSERAALVVQTERYLLIGPDNGLLSIAAQFDGITKIYRIRENPQRWERSTTFDGLSLFAPVAAYALNGMALEEIGDEAETMRMLPLREPREEPGCIVGEIQRFDRFGNAITNIHQRLIRDTDIAAITTDANATLPLCRSYADMAHQPDPVGAVWNSDGFLEIMSFGGDVRKKLQVTVGTGIRIALRKR